MASWGALIVVRSLLYGRDAAADHREASGLGAILLTVAPSIAAQNVAAASWMHAAPLTGRQQAEPVPDCCPAEACPS